MGSPLAARSARMALVRATFSMMCGFLSDKDFDRINNELNKRYTLQSFTEDENKNFVSIMLQDKKRMNGSRFTLLKGIGQAVFDMEVNDEVVLEALKVLQ